jgi:DNA anti-recombination protein RmuC
MKRIIFFIIGAILLSCPVTGHAVEVAPRISDREIIESLADLRGDIKEVRAGQKALAKNMDQRFKAVDQRFDAVEQRFESVDQHFVSFEQKMDQRFKAVDQRFDAIDQRFESVDQHFVSFEQKMDQRFKAVDQRFDAVYQRFDAVYQRFDAVDQRFDSMEKRLDSIDRRFAFFQNLMLVLIAGVFGLIGYIVWDRKTALRPVENRIIQLEAELSHEDGSRLTRLVGALQELAKTDKKVEAVLRSFSLL